MQIALDAHGLRRHRPEQRGTVGDRLVRGGAQLTGEPAGWLEAQVHEPFSLCVRAGIGRLAAEQSLTGGPRALVPVAHGAGVARLQL